MARRACLCAALALPLFSSLAHAQNHEVLAQQLDSHGEGYTVLRLWGSRHDIGFAIGSVFADEIDATCQEARALAGGNYEFLRTAMGYVTWVPPGVEAEFEAMADGVKSVRPSAAVDAVDLMVLNTYGDWAYPPACRSHACWGTRTQPPYDTLSTRRLDFGSPFASVHHHVLYAVDSDDEPVRWVNFAWPGFVSVVTGVNEHGTLVSIHDFNSTVAGEPGVVSRTMAARHLLSSVPGNDVSQHLPWARQQLDAQVIATGTFLNFYAPGGHAGVFSCVAGLGCAGPRTPQSDYRSGEVLITTNSQSDGHTTPEGGEFLDPYYANPAPKTPEDHFEVMIEDELHLLTVGFRARGDMRLLAHGRTNQGFTPRIDVEWSALFPPETPDAGGPDGQAPLDASVPPDGPDAPLDTSPPPDVAAQDAPPEADTNPSAGGTPESDDGCSCAVVQPRASLPVAAWLVPALVVSWCRRRRR